MRACTLVKDINDNNKNICTLCGRIFIHSAPSNKIILVCYNQEGYIPQKAELREITNKPPVTRPIDNAIKANIPNVEQGMPSIGTMAKNAMVAVGQFIANPSTVSKEEYAKRLEVCSSCDKYDDIGNRCMHCGCFLALKAKGAAFHCPLKKWPGDE